MDPDRRRFLKESGIGIAVVTVAGPHLLLSPAEAKAEKIALKVLTETELKTLEAIAEILLPGSAEAGLAYFIDDQIDRDANDSLLMARYFQVQPPYAEFYKAGAQALNAYARANYGEVFYELEVSKQDQIVGSLFPEGPEGWQGPPAALVYLCLRNDVVDVMYGTMEGFKKLDIPYLAHIEPPTKW